MGVDAFYTSKMGLLPIGSASGLTRGTPKIATQVRSLPRERLPLDGPIRDRLAAGSGGYGDQILTSVPPQLRLNTHFVLLTILLRKRGLLSLVELFRVEKVRKSKD